MVGGTNSTIEEYPYVVVLKMFHYIQICTGTIISPNHILTAAQCVKQITKNNSNKYRVHAGNTLIGQGGTFHRIQNISIHNYTGSINDLAVIKLQNRIIFGPTKDHIDMFGSGEEIKNGSIATAIGWGNLDSNGTSAKQLQSIKMVVIDEETCTDTFTKKVNLEGRICASDFGRTQSICNGDPGSPLVVDGKLAGVATDANTNCTSWPVPNVFTEVSQYREWIDKQVLEM